jgi:phage-related protein
LTWNAAGIAGNVLFTGITCPGRIMVRWPHRDQHCGLPGTEARFKMGLSTIGSESVTKISLRW